MKFIRHFVLSRNFSRLRILLATSVLIFGFGAVSYGQITYAQQAGAVGVVRSGYPGHSQNIAAGVSGTPSGDADVWFGVSLKKRYQDAKLKARVRENALTDGTLTENSRPRSSGARRPIAQVNYMVAGDTDDYVADTVDGEYVDEEYEEYIVEDPAGFDATEMAYTQEHTEVDTVSVIESRRNAIRAAQGAPYLRNHSPEPYPGANRNYTVTNPECGVCPVGEIATVHGGSLLGSFGCGGVVPAFGTIGNCPSGSCVANCNTANCNAADLFTGAQGRGFILGWINGGVAFSPDENHFPNRYNDRGNEFLMNQLYLSAGRVVDKNRNRLDVGGRIDLIYGTDYFFTGALGLETYTYFEDASGGQFPVDDPRNAKLRWNDNDGDRRNGTAALYGFSLPQLYAEFFLPIHCGLTVKAGHFYSLMGYESVMAPQNFFYSRSFGSTYGEPTTLTGIVLSQQLTPRLAVIGGITRGWDAWESANDGTSGLVGFKWDTCWGSSVAFTLHTGETSVREGDVRTNYSLVLSQQLNPNWKYVIQHDLGIEENGAHSFVNAVERRENATWASIAQYLECQLTPTCALGARVEWFQDSGHSRILQYPVRSEFNNGSVSVRGVHYYNMTLGMKWRPVEYLTIRPEIRWDWSNVEVASTMEGVPSMKGVYDNFSARSQCTAGIDFVLMF